MAKLDERVASRISIYHDLLSSFHEQLEGHATAADELSKAIESCTNEKYKSELELRFAKLKTC